MDQKEVFATLRDGVKRDTKDNAFDRDATAMALAMISVAEELLSKLERIAVAAERHLELAERNQP